ncbi:MAG TPA: hypothetical protein DIT07_11540, partial [Sphingobacteriaceae bacterium]|nr:hypothetical protein [Sphingobacteriaceae bacterium]
MKKKQHISLRFLCGALFIILVIPVQASAQEKEIQDSSQKVVIEWNGGKPAGTIKILNGRLRSIEIIKGRGKTFDNWFQFTSTGSARIRLEIDSAQNNPGPKPTLISVRTNPNPFSFLLRDVNKNSPIYISDYSVIVLKDSDNRSLHEVQLNILSRKLQTKLQKIESEREESFAAVEKRTLNQSLPTWLGLSRDFRIFQITESMSDNPLQENVITPKFSSSPLILSGVDKDPVSYSYTVGRGVGNEINTHRRLEEGVLPILHSKHIDDEIEYHSTYFVSLEHSSLTQQKGTYYLVADKYSGGHMLTEAQEEKMKTKLEETFNTNEETVLYFRSEITNTGKVPRYAWFKTIKPTGSWSHKSGYNFDPATGFSAFSKDTIFAVSKLNGSPLPNEEMAVLLQPNEKVTFEFYLPHSPISGERASSLSNQSFDEKLLECKNFWLAKLKKAAQIRVPEKRIEEMIQAGLLHLDLVTYGNEPGGTLAPTIGVYAPI